LATHGGRLVITLCAFLLGACGSGAGDAASGDATPALPTAATLGEQQVLSLTDYLSVEPYANADLANGARQAQICRACHSFDAAGPNMIGPALYGFFGTTAGSHPGFQYSEVLLEADFVWTPAALDAWLAQPGRFLPGNRMVFAGIMRQSDRNDLIAYLLTETAPAEGT